MTSIEMPPDDVSHGQHHGDANLITHDIIETCQRRVGERISYMLYAVDEFKDNAGRHIDDHLKGFDEEADVPFGPVVEGFAKGVMAVLIPEAEFAKIALEAATQLIVHELEHAIEGRVADVKEAKAKLHSFVEALSTEVRQREIHAIDTAKQHVPDAVKAGLAQVPELSSNPDWIEQTCIWLGFPEPDHSISDPVRQWLEYEFVGLLARVQAEVELAKGVPGLDEHDINPDRWESEARRSEREMYRQEGGAAWEDAYKMSE